MKRVISLAIAFALSIACLGAFAAASPDGSDMGPLRVGVTSAMSGHLFTEKWGSNTTDVDLKELIHGHNIVSWEENGDYVLNETVVKGIEASMKGGGKAYTIRLGDTLAYNDGAPITARDYAFTALLLSSPEFEALGGAPTNLGYLAGNDGFREGKPFSGVRVIDDHTLELTISSSALPYFYEIVLLNLTPYPIAVLAPGCELRDDGDGAYIEGPFTEDALRASIIGDGDGYLYFPTVSAGPYKLVSIDVENQEASFEVNPHYSGNFEGVRPAIREIAVSFTDAASAIDAISAGELDLVNKVSDGDAIAYGRGLVAEGSMSTVNYLRSGMSFISFSCELGPTSSALVRRAISHCVDGEGVCERFAKGFGMPVYGYYGMGQWMAQENQFELGEYALELDWEAAAELFEEDGWVLNGDGELFDRESDAVRHRMGDGGELERLTLKWAQSDGTPLSKMLEESVRPELEAAGAEMIVVEMPFDDLLSHYYRQADREYNMISVATNFPLAFDPYYTFHTGDEYQGEANRTGLRDEALMGLALDMRRTPVGDMDGYSEKWLAFQARVGETRPIAPLYSNVYFDFFRTDLDGYYSNAYFSWATAIVYASIGDPAED